MKNVCLISDFANVNALKGAIDKLFEMGEVTNAYKVSIGIMTNADVLTDKATNDILVYLIEKGYTSIPFSIVCDFDFSDVVNRVFKNGEENLVLLDKNCNDRLAEYDDELDFDVKNV